ncbi:MAG: hypothetical protein ACK4TA_16200 [Saprospiraceae bacterium]
MNKLIVLTLLLCCFMPKKGIACFCVPLDLATEVKSADVVFLGVLVERHENPAIFSPTMGSYRGLKYLNFEVIKFHKGLSELATKISVFDEYINSNCESLFRDFAIGDTILVMGTIKNKEDPRFNFLSSSGCRRNVAKQNFSKAEIAFISDPSLWTIPQESDIKNFFPAEEKPVEVVSYLPERQVKILICGLILSMLINIILGLIMVQKSRSGRRFKYSQEDDLL